MTSRSLTVAIAALTGFLALSYEILWYRAISCATGGLPASFGMLLAVYLCGLAFGSGISGALCARASRGESSRQLQALASLVGLATVAAWLVCPAFAWTVTQWGDWRPALVAVAVAAALFGSILPLVCHFGIAPDERAGQNLSFVYLANIVGSASGSMVTGFVFMAVWSLRTTSLALALGGIVLMGLVATQSTRVGRARGLLGGLVLAGGVAFWLATPVLYDRIYERLLYGPTFLPTTRFEQVVETKSGVVAVSQDGTVYGGGAYDGRFNVSLDHDGRKNGVFRAYAVGAMHPAPARVLMIGLASGSWAQVVAHLEGVRELTVVEINPGYLEIIARRGEVRSLLSNPKVSIVIDDGRRWLQRHADDRFDVIVMNTTWAWRAHITNLLSVEFLRIAKRHLREGGILYYNSTGSPEVQRTAAVTFPYALRVHSFMAVSDSPFSFDRDRWRHVLTTTLVDGRPALDLSSAAGENELSSLSAYPDVAIQPNGEVLFEQREQLLERTRGLPLVTDDNMVTEWRSSFRPQSSKFF